jgi:toxin YoeB
VYWLCVRKLVLTKGGRHSKFPAKRVAVFHPEFIEDLCYWVEQDRKIALKALEIVEAVMRQPFEGIGKPEPLKHLLAGAWSRRLTQEHRIVYLVNQNQVDFLQARYHY